MEVEKQQRQYSYVPFGKNKHLNKNIAPMVLKLCANIPTPAKSSIAND